MRRERWRDRAFGCFGYHERWRRLDGVHGYDDTVQEVQQAQGEGSGKQRSREDTQCRLRMLSQYAYGRYRAAEKDKTETDF